MIVAWNSLPTTAIDSKTVIQLKSYIVTIYTLIMGIAQSPARGLPFPSATHTPMVKGGLQVNTESKQLQNAHSKNLQGVI